MKLPNFKTVTVSTPDVVLLQDNIQDTLRPLLLNPLCKISFITGVVLAAGDNNVSHLLGVTPQFWFVVDRNAAANIFRKVSATPTLTILLNSSAAVTVSLITG